MFTGCFDKLSSGVLVGQIGNDRLCDDLGRPLEGRLL